MINKLLKASKALFYSILVFLVLNVIAFLIAKLVVLTSPGLFTLGALIIVVAVFIYNCVLE